jgi:hypothetical protein
MKRLLLILAAAGAIGSTGCAEDSAPETDDPSANVEANELGGLSLSLTSYDSQGRAYRLRNATFTIQPSYWYGDGGVSAETVLSTETDPNADRLSVRLVPGQYTVYLGGEWYIERLTASGPERVEKVALLSETAQWAYVGQDWYTDLEFRFGVDGELIDFRHGDLNIDIAIELPGEGPYPYHDSGVMYPSYDAGSPTPPDVESDAGMAFSR